MINKIYKCWFIWAVEAVDDNESDDEEDDEEEVSGLILQRITELKQKKTNIIYPVVLSAEC